MELSLPKGPLVQRVQINPAMCGSLLQYIAPVLAGVTTAQGTFSIDLDDCRIPIGDMKKANMTGRFTVHSMVIGPGPMIHELATFMSRETPAQLKRESVVPFQMVNGRVYHKDLELIFPDITIRSSGSVGVVGPDDGHHGPDAGAAEMAGRQHRALERRCGTRRSPSRCAARWPSRRSIRRSWRTSLVNSCKKPPAT